MPPIATIILAAGGSRRLGSPKQLLRWENSTLIRRAADAATGASLGPVFVLLGANAAGVAAELIGSKAQTVLNENWRLGIHTSIRSGIEAVEHHCPDADAAILMTCDQPFISAETLTEIAKTYRAQLPPCVAAMYAQTLGTPALFRRELFPKLKQLENGARQLIKSLGDVVVPYSFPEGALDIDTRMDYAALKPKH